MLKEGNRVRLKVLNGEPLTEPIEGYVKGFWQASTGKYVAKVQSTEGKFYSIYTDEPTWDSYEVIKTPEVGDTLIVNYVDGKELDEPIRTKVKAIEESAMGGHLIRTDGKVGMTSLLYYDSPHIDRYTIADDVSPMIETPKAGDYILVTSYEGIELDAPHLSKVHWADVNLGGEYVISLTYDIPGLPTVLTLNDLEWEFGEDAEMYQGTSPVSSEDDYPIPPSYAELASQGMTISEYAGEEMSAETLKFKPSEDIVSEPSHYNQGKFETIEMIQEITNGYKVGYVAHCVGTAVKYLSRAPYKSSLLTDLKKARQYITFAIEYLEGER